MSIRKKILAISIGPVLVLGVITLLFILTMVKSSLMDEIQDALKGTAAATLAAYDQNTGDYLESTNGDIWKGSYNISKSESLVDRIKENTGMDVTFFYGNKRIMTSALDKKGNRILGSEAGERVVNQVIKGKKPFLSTNVSLDGTRNYGYFIPVYQTVFDNIGAFIGNLCTYTVVQFADDRHQLRNCFLKESDRPFFKCFCKDCVVGVCTNLRYNRYSLIHKNSTLL